MAAFSVTVSRTDLLRTEIFQLDQDARDARRERTVVEIQMELMHQSHQAGQQSHNALVDHLRFVYPKYVEKDEEYHTLLRYKEEAIKELEDEILKELNSKTSSDAKPKKLSKRKVNNIVAAGVLKGARKLRKNRFERGRSLHNGRRAQIGGR